MEKELAVRCSDCRKVIGASSDDWKQHSAETGHQKYGVGFYSMKSTFFSRIKPALVKHIQDTNIIGMIDMFDKKIAKLEKQ